MGVRAGGSLYDSVTGITFGPVFETVEEADSFLDWYNDRDNNRDLRSLGLEAISLLVTQWHTSLSCSHPGGFRADDGRWECSQCGHTFDSYEAWGTETGNEAAVAAVKGAIEADLQEMS
jgi:ribosomal protein L37AE/L43A